MPIQVRYAAPLVSLAAITGAFFLTRRFRPLKPWIAQTLRISAAAPLLISGTFHLIRPQLFVPALPPPFPQQTWLIIATGIPEILGAVGLFVPRTRRAAALSLALFMIAIFPANVYIAGRTLGGLKMPGVPERTAMQAAYIMLLLICGYGLPCRR